jgi:hypothetical protein
MHGRKPSPATIIAMLALFVALSGSAIAASDYLITSTRQIKPSVLRALRGKQGRRGVPGPEGKAGEKGEPGTEGEAGTEGNAGSEGKVGPSGPGTVVARVRTLGPVATSTTDPQQSPSFVNDPVSEGKWTQSASELDQLDGEVVATAPSRATCSLNGGGQGGAAYVLLDGNIVGLAIVPVEKSARSEVHAPIQWGRGYSASLFAFSLASRAADALLEPGADTPHTLSVEIADNCGADGLGNKGGHFTIDSVAIDVVGVH